MKIIAIVAATADGKIAASSNHHSDWTSPEDKAHMRSLLDKAEVVVVGNNTYRMAIKPLSKRNCIVFTRSVETVERKNENLLLCNPEMVSIKDTLQSYSSVAVLGGTQTYTYFLVNGLLDELYLTIEPSVFGKGLPIFEKAELQEQNLQLLESKVLNEKGSILLHYKLTPHQAL